MFLMLICPVSMQHPDFLVAEKNPLCLGLSNRYHRALNLQILANVPELMCVFQDLACLAPKPAQLTAFLKRWSIKPESAAAAIVIVLQSPLAACSAQSTAAGPHFDIPCRTPRRGLIFTMHDQAQAETPPWMRALRDCARATIR